MPLRKLRNFVFRSGPKPSDNIVGTKPMRDGATPSPFQGPNDATRQSASHSYHNTHYPPFLRLPREIRDEIFSYLYSDLVIHVSVLATKRVDGSNKCRYNLCQSPLTPRERYRHSLLGASFESPVQWASPELETQYEPFHARCREDGFGGDPIPFSVPVVCKQMWQVIADLVYKTATWYFIDTGALPVFAAIGKMAQRVQRLAFVKPFIYNNSFSHWWSSEVDSRALDQFTNLQGLDLLLVRRAWMGVARMDLGSWSDDYAEVGPGARGNVRAGFFVELKRSLNKFKKRGLQKEKTTVVVVVVMRMGARCEDTPVEDRLELAERVRKWLVE